MFACWAHRRRQPRAILAKSGSTTLRALRSVQIPDVDEMHHSDSDDSYSYTGCERVIETHQVVRRSFGDTRTTLSKASGRCDDDSEALLQGDSNAHKKQNQGTSNSHHNDDNIEEDETTEWLPKLQNSKPSSGREAALALGMDM